MTKANWNYPTAVKFGPGRIAELPEALKTAGHQAGRCSSPMRASSTCR